MKTGEKRDGTPGAIALPLMNATLDLRGVLAGLVFSGLLSVLVYIGSQGLRGFDGALAGYLFSTLFALFGIVYRYVVWLQRPPTQVYWQRGWQLFWTRGKRLGNTLLFFKLTWQKLLAQGFIRRRSRQRWLAHQLIFWGVVLASLITFPLTFGWIRFESTLQDASRNLPVLFGFRLEFAQFQARSVTGWIIFHLLDIAAFLCLAGISLALPRHIKDQAELSTQRLDNDFIPLLLLFAVSVTGLMLTVSNLWMAGKFYYWITTTHAVTVMLWLLFLPFGKFFHIFQRIANLGVWFYKAAGGETEQARCLRCDAEYVSMLQREDLKRILPTLGFDYDMDGANWQDVCPACRRKLMTLNQFRAVGKTFL